MKKKTPPQKAVKAAPPKNARPRNAFYAQSGGVTAVINASACGVIETAAKYPKVIGKVFAGKDGIVGALTEQLIDTSRESRERRELAPIASPVIVLPERCSSTSAGSFRERAISRDAASVIAQRFRRAAGVSPLIP